MGQWLKLTQGRLTHHRVTLVCHGQQVSLKPVLCVTFQVNKKREWNAITVVTELTQEELLRDALTPIFLPSIYGITLWTERDAKLRTELKDQMSQR